MDRQRKPTMANRLTLNDLDHLLTGKRLRLHRLMYQSGPGNGTLPAAAD